MSSSVKKIGTVKRVLKKKKNLSVSARKAKKRNQAVKSIRYQDYLTKTLQDPKEGENLVFANISIIVVNVESFSFKAMMCLSNKFLSIMAS